MTAPADHRASRAATASAFQPATVRPILFIAAWAFSSPAAAQVGAAVSVFSDDRFRGYSLSDGRPVGILDLSYDAPGGLYGALSGTVVATRDDGLQPLGVQLNGGYAKRLTSGLTMDFGFVQSRYFKYSTRPAKSYTEMYAGIAGKILSSRISVSPNYLKQDAWTLYGEVNAIVPAARKLRLIGHVGMLVPFARRSAGESYRTELDWRLGVARDFGPVTLNVSWTGITRNRDVYQYRSYGRSRVILGLTYVL